MHHTTFARWDAPAWIVAIVLFGVLDVATTIVGINHLGAVEANALVAPLIDALGLWILVPLKALVIGLFALLYRYVPAPARSGVPIGLGVLGALIVSWNVSILVSLALA